MWVCKVEVFQIVHKLTTPEVEEGVYYMEDPGDADILDVQLLDFKCFNKNILRKFDTAKHFHPFLPTFLFLK